MSATTTSFLFSLRFSIFIPLCFAQYLPYFPFEGGMPMNGLIWEDQLGIAIALILFRVGHTQGIVAMGLDLTSVSLCPQQQTPCAHKSKSVIPRDVCADGLFTVQQNAKILMGWGGVGWGNNVHCHFHTNVMLRHCPFLCNFHTYVMLRHCTFFCNFHTYVMLGWGGVGWGGAITFIATSTHTWCYATARSCATSTHTWCYATARSSATSTHTWCYAGVGWGGAITFIATYTHTWCYATARSCATSTHTWCYATARSSATSTHTWCYAGVGWGGAITFIATSTHTWCYATACSSATSNGIPSTKGSMKVSRKIFRYVRSFQWRRENPRELLKTTATFIKQLSWFDFGPLEEEKTLRGLSMEKLNPQVRRPLFFSQNWRFAMAKR